MRKKIYNKVWKIARLMEEQNWKCYYCNCKFEDDSKSKRVTLDHLEPYYEVWNKTKYVLACHRCNFLKWNISEELYKDWYICVNIKHSYNWQSENTPMKVRKPINWFQKTFPNLFYWNKPNYKITYKLYE
jgi:hypothetical protein